MCNELKTAINIEDNTLEERIKNYGVLYFLRATPFTEYGEYNYNGALAPEFFFENLFTTKGQCNNLCKSIINQIVDKHKKSIILIGNQGCGKTTFVHHLKRELNGKRNFHILDFDKDTSNPNLNDYIEIFSSHLSSKFRNDCIKNNGKINKIFYNLYCSNKGLILTKINGANKVKKFFEEFKMVFIDHKFDNNDPSNFINNINKLFFNQILSLVILWNISEFLNLNEIIPVVFCLDNLDVLVNSEIINGFFEEYYTFVRNIDSIIQKLKNPYVSNIKLEYNKIFTFVFSCRQHTWAKVKQSFLHQSNIITLSTYEKNITSAFDKNAILEKRDSYIQDHADLYEGFSEEISNVRALLEDMNEWNNIYDLFDDDYRQCSITFEQLLEDNPNLLDEYIELKSNMSSKPLYGARGLIYKALFDKFRDEDLFNLIGVLDVNSTEPPVSDARILLNYLDYHTFGERQKSAVSYEQIVHDFEGIVDEKRINYSLIHMFKLGVADSLWNELIAFVQINSDELDDCKGTKIFITKAGHEYLDLLSTHFEFFNVRVKESRKTDTALYSNTSIQPYTGNKKYKYNFQETIQNVINVVATCCKKMSIFYENVMFKKYNGKDNYLNSEFVYGGNGKIKVFHGERIIHTHVRYIDHYRLFILKNRPHNLQNNEINKLLLDFIKEYIKIGRENPNVLSKKSHELFLGFDKKIETIEKSGYSDYTTAINITYTL